MSHFDLIKIQVVSHKERYIAHKHFSLAILLSVIPYIQYMDVLVYVLKDECTRLPLEVFCNHKKEGTNQIFISRTLIQLITGHPYNGLLNNCKKERGRSL